MDKISERKHRHELKRKAKRTFVRIQKGYAEGKIGEYGSRSLHHHGNIVVEAPPTPPMTKEQAEAIRTELIPQE